MDKLDMHSPDLTERNIDRIAELFPTVMTEMVEGEGESRLVKRAIDFDLLRQELSDHVVEGPLERYRLDWPGKREALFAANAPIAKTLRPVREDSVNFDSTQNLFIEGDNLDALKLLQESYLGKVKLIYIDPPYNSGNDRLLYEDDSVESNSIYLARSGQVDSDGRQLLANTEANGRFHSDWLSTMFPRLRLARDFLTDDGVIMASISDAEVVRLRLLLDEVFGQANFLGQLIWMKGREGGNDNDGFGQHHEYVLVYARNKRSAGEAIALDPKDLTRHRRSLPEPNRVVAGQSTYREGEEFQLINLSKQKDYIVKIPLRDGTTVEWPSYAPQSTVDNYIQVGKVFVGSTGVPYVKSFLADEAAGTKPSTLIDGQWGTTKAGGIEVRDLFGSGKIFSYPKPSSLIQRLITVAGASADSVIMDFFAGSGTTAHAVMAANAADGGRRRFIMVQLDERCAADSEAAKAGFSTIAELSRERIRRAAAKVAENSGLMGDSLDLGFRALKIDTTNMADVLRVPDAQDQGGLGLFTDSIKPDRTHEDLLFQVLLDRGLELTMPIKVEKFDGRNLLTWGNGALIACFDADVSVTVVREIASRRPLGAVFRDSGFATDADRINAQQVFTEVSPGTDVKAI